MSARRSLAGFAVVAALLAAFVALRLEVTTDISVFLPTGEQREAARLSKAIASSEMSRVWVVALQASSDREAAALSRAFEDELRRDAELMEALGFLEGGPAEGFDRALWAIVEPRRLTFVAATPSGARAMITDEGLHGAAQELKRRLASPMSTLVSRIAPEDPFLALPRLFERAQAVRPEGLEVVEGRFVAQRHHAIILLGTVASAFDAPAQRDVFERLKRAVPPGSTMKVSALGRYSIVAAETIQADIQRTTILSVVGLLALALVLFRSLRLA